MPVKFKPIVPKDPDFNASRRELSKGVKETGDEINSDFKSTTSTWESSVKFRRKDNLRGSKAFSTLTDTSDEIYSLVSRGTRPHVIQPRRARRLVFKGTFRAKTLPGTIRARQGGQSGGTVVTTVVEHPGTEPRNFDRTLKEKHEPLFRSRVQDAMDRAAKVSGHSL